MIQMFPETHGARSASRISAAKPSSCDAGRWAVWRKAAAALAVESGQLTEQEACALHGLDADELQLWQRLLKHTRLKRTLLGPIA
jgi:hypothetical protein